MTGVATFWPMLFTPEENNDGECGGFDWLDLIRVGWMHAAHANDECDMTGALDLP